MVFDKSVKKPYVTQSEKKTPDIHKIYRGSFELFHRERFERHQRQRLGGRGNAQTHSREHQKKQVQIRHREKNNEYKYVEDLLREKLDTKVKVKDKKLQISFVNDADLNRILEILDIKE